MNIIEFSVSSGYFCRLFKSVMPLQATSLVHLRSASFQKLQ